MTARAAIRQSDLNRALKAADKAGCRIKLLSDGSILFLKPGDIPEAEVDQPKDDAAKWRPR